MFGPIVLIVAQLSASLLNFYAPVSPLVAAKRVAKCGGGAVSVKFDTDLEADVLVVAASAVSEQQLVCMVEAASFYAVELPPALQRRFDALSEERFTARMASDARQWLQAHELLDRIPRYERGVTDDPAFGREVETLCRADRALQTRHGAQVVIPDVTLRHGTDAPPEDGPDVCLLHVGWVTGFKMGFIGNEQAAP